MQLPQSAFFFCIVTELMSLIYTSPRCFREGFACFLLLCIIIHHHSCPLHGTYAVQNIRLNSFFYTFLCNQRALGNISPPRTGRMRELGFILIYSRVLERFVIRRIVGWGPQNTTPLQTITH